MSGFVSFGGGGASQPSNPNATYELIGFDAERDGTSVAAHATANTKGSWTTIGTTTNALCEFVLHLYSPNNARFWVDLRIGGSTVILPDLYFTSQFFAMVYTIPVAIPASTLIEARCQASTGSNTVTVGLVGTVADSSLPPGFTLGERINPANGSTSFPSSTNIALSSSGPTWTQLNAGTTNAYGAVLATASYAGVNPANAQSVHPVIGFDATAGSTYSEYGMWSAYQFASSGGINWNAQLFRKTIPSGSSVAGGVFAQTPGSDSARFCLIGFR